jgi:hypothetical protein
MDGIRVVESASYADRYRTPRVAFWRFDGHVVEEAKVLPEPSGAERYFAKGQGKFSLSVFKDRKCIDMRQPWIEQIWLHGHGRSAIGQGLLKPVPRKPT